jgi:protein-disulfide isomerase
MSEAAVKAMPRRGRLWVAAILALGLVGLGYSIVQISTQKADDHIIRIAGISEAQEIFGGIPQEGDRLGSSDAPVTAQVFNDLQCSSCREAFLSTIPALAENYARPGTVKFLYRHYSNAENPVELGFYGAEAAAEQGYGWQYTYLFFVNQEEAEKVPPNHFQEFLDSAAGGVEELNAPEWEKTLEEAPDPEGPIQRRLESYDELGRELGIRVGQALVISGPNGTQTLQDSPKLGEIERAIAEVE